MWIDRGSDNGYLPVWQVGSSYAYAESRLVEACRENYRESLIDMVGKRERLADVVGKENLVDVVRKGQTLEEGLKESEELSLEATTENPSRLGPLVLAKALSSLSTLVWSGPRLIQLQIP